MSSTASTSYNRSGFAVLQFVVALVIIGIVAALGYKYLDQSQAATATNIFVPASTGGGVAVPSHGVYWGGTNSGDTITVPGCTTQTGFNLLECKVGWAGQVQGLASTTSYESSMEHFYTDCAKPIPSSVTSSSKKAGRKVLMVNMTCGNWTVLAGGDANAIANIKARTTELIALNIPVILSFHHEPENDSCSSVGTYFGSPEDYRAAYRTFSATVRTTTTATHTNNIAMGWILMGFTFDKAGTTLWNGSCSGHTTSDSMIRNPDNWYPGDDAVDWLLADAYDGNGTRNFDQEIANFVTWTNSCTAVKPTSNYSCTANRATKPIGLAETSVQGTVDHRAAFFDDMALSLPKYPKFRAYAFWSSSAAAGFNGILDRADDPTHASLKAFARLELSDYVHTIVINKDRNPAIVVEPETGLLSGPSTLVNDPSASHSSSARFNLH